MCVRPSTASYGGFSLGMGRSPGFGSAPPDRLALFRLGFPPAPRLKRLTSPGGATRRTVLQKVRGRALIALPQLVDAGFQALFHSPPGVLFTFPSQYCALSVTGWCLGLGGGPPGFPQGSSCPVVLWMPPTLGLGFAYGALTLSGWLSQCHSAAPPNAPGGPQPGRARTPVWPLPLSLAATHGIDVSFLSSGYLDVSVRRVPPHALCVHAWVHRVRLCGSPHSDTRGSPGICPSPRLFAACRVFHRPPVPRHPPCALTCLAYAACSVTPVASALACCFLSSLVVISFNLVDWMSPIWPPPYGLSFTVCGFQGACGVSAVMEIKGFEPLTPCLQGRCSPN